MNTEEKKRLTLILAIGFLVIATTVYLFQSAFLPPEKKKFCTGASLPGPGAFSIVDWESSLPVKGATVLARVTRTGLEITASEVGDYSGRDVALYVLNFPTFSQPELGHTSEDFHLRVQKGPAIFEGDYVFRKRDDDICAPFIPDPPIGVIELRRPESLEKTTPALPPPAGLSPSLKSEVNGNTLTFLGSGTIQGPLRFKIEKYVIHLEGTIEVDRVTKLEVTEEGKLKFNSVSASCLLSDNGLTIIGSLNVRKKCSISLEGPQSIPNESSFFPIYLR